MPLHHQVPQTLRGNDDDLDRLRCLRIDQRRAARKLRQLADEVTGAVGDDRLAPAESASPTRSADAQRPMARLLNWRQPTPIESRGINPSAAAIRMAAVAPNHSAIRPILATPRRPTPMHTRRDRKDGCAYAEVPRSRSECSAWQKIPLLRCLRKRDLQTTKLR